ncbi:hypothetical protein QAD02_005507 [Eretmocerus hayati]|uniref:Uncharacterized protein n=1 Tax=Eretmocerus hayati TaxID=131215 RepID=A0ACC2NSI3_9HYME|nr:hypothetical protein QAD02_005507 [Eretmocerus hayati]
MSVFRIVACALILVMFTILQKTDGHGRMMDPVSRSSAWRKGFKTPTNYDDNQLYCGGVHQDKDRPWTNDCGVCGDSYNTIQPRPNENGGLYGTGIIVRRYRRGQRIKVLLDLTASHKGFFEFSVCPLQGAKDIETEQCFKQYPLKFTGRSSVAKTTCITSQIFLKEKIWKSTLNDIHRVRKVSKSSIESNSILDSNQMKITQDESQDLLSPGVKASANEARDFRVPVNGTGKYIIELILPQGLSCKQCSLRWEYTGGNIWGNCLDGSNRLGCGPQETFRNCADISIL